MRTAQWKPSSGQQFVAISGNGCKLELLTTTDLQAQPKLILSSTREIFTPPNAVNATTASCFHWNPQLLSDQSLLAYGTSTGSVHVIDWLKNTEVTLNSPQLEEQISKVLCMLHRLWFTIHWPACEEVAAVFSGTLTNQYRTVYLQQVSQNDQKCKLFTGRYF